MIKKFKIFESLDENWVPMPDEYYPVIGEEVKINPNSQYINQVAGDGKGQIKEFLGRKKGDEVWCVEWYNGRNDCYYWRKDLLINVEKAEKLRKELEKLRKKHIHIDPYGEEDWLEN